MCIAGYKSVMQALTFESIDKADRSGCLRTAGLVREADIAEVLHVFHQNPLRLLLHSQISRNKRTSCMSQKLQQLGQSEPVCFRLVLFESRAALWEIRGAAFTQTYKKSK